MLLPSSLRRSPLLSELGTWQTTAFRFRGDLEAGGQLQPPYRFFGDAGITQTAIDQCGYPAILAGAMPVPAGYTSDSHCAAFASSASLIPPPPINTRQPGVVTSLLYSGSKFRGHQKSKGNSYDVEVVLQVGIRRGIFHVKGEL